MVRCNFLFKNSLNPSLLFKFVIHNIANVLVNRHFFLIKDCCDGKYQAKFGLIPFRKSSYNIGSNNTISRSSSPSSPAASELFQRGWLIHETLVQLKLHGGSALQIWKQKHKNKDLFIKVTPIETSRSSLGEGVTSSRQNSVDMEESTDISDTRAKRKQWPVVEVAVSCNLISVM